jgi:hypothetical protein
VQKLSLGQTYPNGITSTVVGPTSIPMILPSDRLALAAALATCNAVGRAPRLLRLANTLKLEEFAVSASLLDDVAQDPRLEVVAGPTTVTFDSQDNFTDLGAPGASLAAASEPAAVASGH